MKEKIKAKIQSIIIKGKYEVILKLIYKIFILEGENRNDI